MKHQSVKKPNDVPRDAVLLIPEPDDANAPAPYGIKPGYYNRAQLLELIGEKKNDPVAIRFIADMLETGNPEDDEFASLLRTKSAAPAELMKIVSICLEQSKS